MSREEAEAELTTLQEAEDTLSTRITSAQNARRSIQQRISELQHSLATGTIDEEPPRIEMPLADALAIVEGSQV